MAVLNQALEGRYLIESALGQGGMALVYLARDLKHDRPVAIKVLRPQLSETVVADRFLREIRIAANLTHPHILPLHDSGQVDGLLYYVMPYVVGESLRDRLEAEGRLPVTETARLLRQIVEALVYAHAHGVVHRDVKPDNVMLSGRDALVTDFGVAKAVSEAIATGGAEGTGMTAVGSQIGTPHYMAPEQVLGDPNLDHRADIYALGVMAYEMLTGHPPFEGPTQHEVFAQHVTEAPVHLGEADAAIPERLAEIVMTCLAKRPEDRWQSLEEVLGDLEVMAAVDRETLDLIAPGAATRLRRRTLAWAAGMAVVVAAGLWMVRDGRGPAVVIPAADAKAIAVLPFTDLSDGGANEFFADGLAEELITALSRVPDLRVTGRTSSFAFKGEGLDAKTIGGRLGVGSVVDGSVRRAGDQVRISVELVNTTDGFQVWGDSYNRTMADIFAVQEEVAQSVVSALEVELAGGGGESLVDQGTMDVVAFNAYLEGRFHWNRRTATDLMAAAAAFSRAISVDSNFARAWSGLADAYVLYPPYGVPQLTWEDAIGRAEAAARRAISIDGSLAEAHASLGLILDAKWQWEEAGQAFRQAIALNPRYASAHQWYGIYLIGLGRLDEGLEHLRTAFEMDRLSPIIGSWVALALDALGRTEEASAQFAHVLDYAPNAAFLHRDVWLHHMRSGDAAAGALHLERYLVLSGASSGLAASWRAGLEDPVARDATLRAIADSAANDFKLSVDLNARLGRADIALALLQQRSASPARLRDSAGALRVYVLENAVREDPRFIPILQRMGLPTVAVGQNRR